MLVKRKSSLDVCVCTAVSKMLQLTLGWWTAIPLERGGCQNIGKVFSKKIQQFQTWVWFFKHSTRSWFDLLTLKGKNLIWHTIWVSVSLRSKLHNFIVQLRNSFIICSTIQLQHLDASIRKINPAAALTIHHKTSTPSFCVMKYFQVSMFSWFPVCGTNSQGRVLWGGGINCRWEKWFRKFGDTMPEVLHLVPSCTSFCSDGSLYSCDKWHFKPDPALCTTAACDWSASQKPAQHSAALAFFNISSTQEHALKIMLVSKNYQDLTAIRNNAKSSS